jgi:fumarate hydratase subunit alpha
MRKINVSKVKDAVAELCVESNISLRRDILRAIKRAAKSETKKQAKQILKVLLENAEIARRESRPLCQDTGIVSAYLEVGQGAAFVGGDLKTAVNKGVSDGYKKGFLRKSVVKSPILRVNTSANTPPVIYTDIVRGSGLRITVMPKGFGSENKSALKMLKPTEGEKEIADFALEVIKKAGPDACPPYILGIGLGGTFDKAAILAKKALALPLDKPNPLRHLGKLEHLILEKANRLGIGVMGLGGRTTCLGVRVLEHPTHIAGLPVAVNLGCHSTRSATRVI